MTAKTKDSTKEWENEVDEISPKVEMGFLFLCGILYPAVSYK